MGDSRRLRLEDCEIGYGNRQNKGDYKDSFRIYKPGFLLNRAMPSIHSPDLYGVVPLVHKPCK